jgi:hypothetical protein
MAGSNAAFNPGEFRTAIRDAMNMGLPANVSERATFKWNVERTYTVADPGDNPYDWNDTPVSTTTHADVQIPVAVEFTARASDAGANNIGSFDPSRVTLTVLDEDYALVQGADEVLLGGNAYVIRYVAPPLGLFEVTVYQIFAEARDES